MFAAGQVAGPKPATKAKPSNAINALAPCFCKGPLRNPHGEFDHETLHHGGRLPAGSSYADFPGALAVEGFS